MPKLEILITDPDVQTLRKPDLLWSASGLPPAELEALARRGDALDALEAGLLRGAADASIVKVRFARGRPVAVSAWRGIWSDHHVFWALRPGGDLLLADHFRNALSRIPVSQRQVSDAALTEHFLYRQVLGELSYCSAIQRLGHGEQIQIDLSSASIKTSLFDRIESRPEELRVESHVDRIDGALADALEPVRRQSDVANQFSGGVDSTLLQTYLGRDAVALNLVPDAPEFELETHYASRAASLLKLPLERHPVREADYLEQLEQTIDEMGLPPIHEGTILDRQCYALGFPRYVVGEHGDTVFGLGGRRARIAWPFAGRLGSRALGFARSCVPGSLRERFDAVRTAAAELGQDPQDVLGHPVQRNLSTDLGLAEAIFGAERVRERLRANLDYALARVVLAAPRSKRFLRNLEIARWIGTFDDVILPQRHLAQARGSSVVSPFAAPGVVASVLAVPIERRYLRGLQDKYLLKRLLARRLPGYPVNQRKRATELPFVRFYREGPLAEVWERYPFPEFIEEPARGRVIADASGLTWNAVTWAIWSQRVARNPDLSPLAGSRILEWES